MIELAFREMVQYILIKAYALTTKFCGHRGKSNTTWEQFTAGMCLVVQSKEKFMKMVILFQVHTQMTL